MNEFPEAIEPPQEPAQELSFPIPLRLGQIIYTSFAKLGFQALTSTEVPSEIREKFIQQIVHEHWNSYNPPGACYRAAYLHQISSTQTLFGWLYNDGRDDFGRSHVPYFVCYYLAKPLQRADLRVIFMCLLKGPIKIIDRQSSPDTIEGIEIFSGNYQSARPGVGIFAPVQEQAALGVQQGKLFTMFLSEDSTGQSLKFATSIDPERNSAATHALALDTSQVLSRKTNASELPETIKAQDSSKIIHELITRAELEKYQHILRAKVQSNMAQPLPMRGWKSIAASQKVHKALIAATAFSVLTVSSVYLLRRLPSTILPFPSSQESIFSYQKSIPGLGVPMLAKTLLDSAPVWSVVLSPDGQTVISGGANLTIKIWNIETGKVLKTLSGHQDVVRSLILTPDGKTLMSGSGDRTIKIWDLRTNQLLQTLEQGSPVWGLTLSPDGKTLFSGGEDGVLKVWRLASGELLQTKPAHQSRICSIAVSPDGTTVATASVDHTIKLWDAQTGTLVRTMTGHTDTVRALAFSPDGTTLASASLDKTLKLWAWQTGKLLRTFIGHNAGVIDVRFSPDGQTLISGGLDNRINFWAVHDSTLLRSLLDHTDWVFSLSIAPQFTPSPEAYHLVSSSKDQTIRIWQFR